MLPGTAPSCVAQIRATSTPPLILDDQPVWNASSSLAYGSSSLAFRASLPKDHFVASHQRNHCGLQLILARIWRRGEWVNSHVVKVRGRSKEKGGQGDRGERK